MKKLSLLLVFVGLALFSSCEKESKEKPFPIGTWRTTHQYFNLTVNDDAYPETIKEMREREESIVVPEAESYRLTFKEDGTGYGSGVHPDENERYDFHFTWELSGGSLSITATEPDAGVFYDSRIPIDMDWNALLEVGESAWSEEMVAMKKTAWEIEESTADNMVLSMLMDFGIRVADLFVKIDETHTYRYTFEKVK